MGLGLPPTTSPVTGEDITSIPSYLHSSSAHFRDQSGRTILLRGINLSASAKTPIGQPGHKLDGFWETAKSGEMSFVGRVLDLDNGVADQHLTRLKSWGFNCLRYVITWESLEHKGPKQYDTDYINYTIKLLRKCKDYGFWVYIDPHQDLWSRFSGGSGAPYWTLPACGLEPENFSKTIAAIIQCEWKNAKGDYDPAAFPDMIWATNYSRLACQTVITMFFAGRDYAPKCILDGHNIQDWLQDHYFDALKQLGNAIRDAGDLLDSCVIGWDSLNEPNAGYLGIADINEHGKESVLRVGPMPTAFQAMQLGMGQKVVVENWRTSSIGPKRDGSMTVDPEGVRAWLDPAAEANGSKWGWTRDPGWKLGTCIWAQHGVWNAETNEILVPDYFDWFRGEAATPRKVDYGADYWLTHWRRFAPIVRSFHPDAIHFIQSPVFQIPPVISGPEISNRAAHSSHFYDGLTLVTKHWNWFNADAIGILRGHYGSVILGLKVGETAIRKCMRDQLGVLRQDTYNALGQYPTMMGEIGIPYDLDNRKAYSDGDYTPQTRALDASMNACDGSNVLNYTLWCYTPDNTHEFGDLWNGEDLSVWSGDDVERMIRHRASSSQLDLVGKIAKKRSRAGSKVSLLTNGTNTSNDGSTTVFGSRSTTPNVSTVRLDGPAAAALVAGGSSLAAPGQAGASLGDLELSLALDERTLADNDPYQPINLNDGARAIAAFCRPYPVKTVGRPIDINFDIRSSKFTLSIEIEAGDVDDGAVQTEIYVPLIHYAAFPSRVSQEVRDDLAADGAEDDGEGTVFGQAPRPQGAQAVDGEDPRALALKVTVSEGTWTTAGQTLRWTYGLPVAGKAVVKLELERANGAIPTWVNQWARGRDAPDAEVAERRRREGGRSKVWARRELYGVLGVAGVLALSLSLGLSLR